MLKSQSEPLSQHTEHTSQTRRISKKTVIASASVIVALLLWMIAWKIVGERMEQTATDMQYTHFTYNGAIYARCPDATTIYELDLTGNADDCGESLGTVQFTVDGVTIHKEAYRVKGEVSHAIADPVLLISNDTKCVPYELVGFTALNDSPSITAVCEAYGIQSEEDIVSITVFDADGSVVQSITDLATRRSFYEKLIALGEDMGTVGQLQAYYDAYIAKYGASDAITLKDDTIETTDNETYQQAMELWGAGMCTVTIQLQNGLRLADMVYAPVPKVFQVYGYYAITEPFFE